MPKLIGFGASTMQGVGDSRGGFFRRLEEKLGAGGHPHDCLNFGIGGNSTPDMLARIDQVTPHLPCRSIILLGCNDLPRAGDTNPGKRTSLQDYARNLETILRHFAKSPAIFVSSFAVCPKRTGIDPATFATYLGEALRIATSLNLQIWDLYAESLSFGDKYWADDGLHYNDAGHEFIAGRILPLIRV
jgi:lysophospholipase L1-like esterase